MKKIIGYAAFVMSLTSCTTTQKATEFLQKKGALASVCAEAFPVKDSLVTRDQVQIDTVTHTDIKYAYDTIYVHGEPVIIQARCPPSQTITKIIYRDSIHYQTNTAEVKVWQQKVDSLIKVVAEKDKVVVEKEKVIAAKDSNIKDLTDSLNQWRKWCLITWLIVAAYIVLRVWNPIQLPFKI